MADDVSQMIADKINFWQTRGPMMAAECEAEDGGKKCFVCGRRDGLVLVMPGWGGVWACRPCQLNSAGGGDHADD